MTAHRLKLAKRDAIVMHPGPIIRGLELTGEVADGPQSVIVDEVRNGVPTRMAILARAVGKSTVSRRFRGALGFRGIYSRPRWRMRCEISRLQFRLGRFDALRMTSGFACD